jgi:hypothetical protein
VSEPIGAAGRAALALAQERHRRARPQVLPVAGSGLALVQRADAPTAAGAATAPATATSEAATPANERDGSLPSAEAVAERVYRLFCRDLRLERERGGRWRRGVGAGKERL